MPGPIFNFNVVKLSIFSMFCVCLKVLLYSIFLETLLAFSMLYSLTFNPFTNFFFFETESSCHPD